MARTLRSSITFGVLAFIAVAGLVFAGVGIKLGYDDKSPSGHSDGAYFSRWWAIILEAVVAVAIGVVVASGNLAKLRTVSIAALVVTSAVVMATLHCALYSVEVIEQPTNKRNAEFAAGGLALLAIVNFVSIILLGVGESSDALVLPAPKISGANWSLRKIISASVFVVILLCGWGLMLAGTIARQVDCSTGHAAIGGDPCEIPLRFTWWTIAFEFAVMIWVVFAMGLDSLERMGAAIAGFIALVTVNLMDEAEVSVDNLMGSKAGPMERLVAAGVLILCICNLLIIMFFAVGGVMKVHEEDEEGVSQVESTEWVSGATIAFFPLLLGLALALGGVVRVHLNFCDENEKPEHVEDCNSFFRSSYWAFAFELLVVIGIVLLATLKKHAIARVRGFVVTLLVLASAETMREVGEMLKLGTDGASLGSGATSLGISAAGFMTVTAMNFVWLIILGMEGGSSSPDGYQPAPV